MIASILITLLAGFLLLGLIYGFIFFIFRAANLFPKLIFVTLLSFSIYEYGNLTGFSWKKFKYADENMIVENAVMARYGYDLSEFSRNYPDFKPKAEYWGDWIYDETDSHTINKLLGIKHYQVRLPDIVAVLDIDGEYLYSRSCGSNSPYCTIIPPKNPEVGLVGTVQYGEPTYLAANDISVDWSDRKGKVFVSGHCFSAYHESAKDIKLRIKTPSGDSFEMGELYGFYIVAITGIERHTVHSIGPISKTDFIRSQSCSPEARASWPNVGGYAWRR